MEYWPSGTGMAKLIPPSARILPCFVKFCLAPFAPLEFDGLEGMPLPGAKRLTNPPQATRPRTTPSSIRVAVTSKQVPRTRTSRILVSRRAPSVTGQPQSATAT